MAILHVVEKRKTEAFIAWNGDIHDVELLYEKELANKEIAAEVLKDGDLVLCYKPAAFGQLLNTRIIKKGSYFGRVR